MKSKDQFTQLLSEIATSNQLPQKYKEILTGFFNSYIKTLEKHDIEVENQVPILKEFISYIKKQLVSPYDFKPFHKQVLEPDYFSFGKNFIRPLIDLSHSTLVGLENLKKINQAIVNKENVVLFANHQIEADPQVLFIMLEKHFPDLAKNIIFVAGERVITDPLAVPFSLGCNLFCIYSKKYIDHPPEKKYEKQLHNKKTMQLMSETMQEGGRCIYVAPSGGRDRKNQQGKVEVASFDPQSIEMFYLMAKKANRVTHFFPLSLATYSILPPPEDIQVELGEVRITQGGPVHLTFGKEIDMETFEGHDPHNKKHNKMARAQYIHSIVKNAYRQFPIIY